MAYQTVFKRYELKYLLTEAQKQAILRELSSHMAPDQYGQTTIRNIYFDTPNHRLIRRSIEKPVYKEKLRIRSYAQAEQDSIVFVELKKKFDSVVYKRRVAVTEAEATAWLCHRKFSPSPSQITREIDYFLDFYGVLQPAVFLSYDRQAFYGIEEPKLRITFDENILCRTDRLSLCQAPEGTPILPPGLTLMEVKAPGSIPLWLTRILTENHIFKTSYSKYGIAYQTLLFPKEVITNGNTV